MEVRNPWVERAMPLLPLGGQALAFSGVAWWGWSPTAVFVSFFLHLAAAGFWAGWKALRDPYERLAWFVKPTLVGCGLATIEGLAVVVVGAAGTSIVATTLQVAVLTTTFVAPTLRDARRAMKTASYPALRWPEAASYLVRLIAATAALSFVYWKASPPTGFELHPDAALARHAAMVLVMVGVLCDALERVGRARHAVQPDEHAYERLASFE